MTTLPKFMELVTLATIIRNLLVGKCCFLDDAGMLLKDELAGVLTWLKTVL